MPKTNECSYCGKKVQPGFGMMYVQKTGSVLFFCSAKCQTKSLKHRSDPKKLKWTKKYEKKIL